MTVYRIATALALGVACSCLTGCAYLTTYSKQVTLDGTTSLSIDVKQRVVVSQRREDKNGKVQVVTCAEPSPDAMAVIGASAGGSFGVSTPQGNTTGNVAAALSESGAFVGLRTQSIQLLRDAMYRLCESYAAGGIDENEYEGMQRRFQSTMMGLIAIEQLTRPVVAGQALLMASAGAQAGAGAGDAQVQAAQTRVTEQRTKVSNAESALETKRAVLGDSKAKYAAEQARYKATPDDEKPTVAADVETARLQVQTDTLAVKAAERDLEREQRGMREAELALQQAESRASATTATGGSLGEVARSTTDSTEKLADSVNKIVVEINKSYMRDSCFNLYSRVLYRQGDVTLKLMDLRYDLATVQGRTVDAQKQLKAVITEAERGLATLTGTFGELRGLCNDLMDKQAQAEERADELRKLEAQVREKQLDLLKSGVPLSAGSRETTPAPKPKK